MTKEVSSERFFHEPKGFC